MQIIQDDGQIDAMANAQRFMRDQDPSAAQMNPLRIEVPASTHEDATKPSKPTPRSTQENRDQVQSQSPMGQDLMADQALESATQREPALSDNLMPEEQAQSHSDLPREPASRPEILHQQQQ